MKKHFWWLLPLVALAIFTPFSAKLDLSAAQLFYKQGKFQSSQVIDFFYDDATKPAMFIGIVAAVVLAISYFWAPIKAWRKSALVLVLTMVIGAGFIVHTLLKDHWGRPRPKQIVEFGGNQAFRPYYNPNFFDQKETSRSFPCGHCTMGFYFFAVGFIFRRIGYQLLEYLSYFLALVWGGAIGITRMAQGGHFLSDVLMTALILWLVAGFFDWLIYEEFE